MKLFLGAACLTTFFFLFSILYLFNLPDQTILIRNTSIAIGELVLLPWAAMFFTTSIISLFRNPAALNIAVRGVVPAYTLGTLTTLLASLLTLFALPAAFALGLSDWWVPAFAHSLAVAITLLPLRTLQLGHCPSCLYDLQGHTTAGCPECGWNRDPLKCSLHVPAAGGALSVVGSASGSRIASTIAPPIAS